MWKWETALLLPVAGEKPQLKSPQQYFFLVYLVKSIHSNWQILYQNYTQNFMPKNSTKTIDDELGSMWVIWGWSQLEPASREINARSSLKCENYGLLKERVPLSKWNWQVQRNLYRESPADCCGPHGRGRMAMGTRNLSCTQSLRHKGHEPQRDEGWADLKPAFPDREKVWLATYDFHRDILFILSSEWLGLENKAVRWIRGSQPS